jgi:hypothetical protein
MGKMDWDLGKQGSDTLRVIVFGAVLLLPQLAFAQATSPFLTSANSLQTNILVWLTPVAIILIMVSGGMALANRMSRRAERSRRRSLDLYQLNKWPSKQRYERASLLCCGSLSKDPYVFTRHVGSRPQTSRQRYSQSCMPS